MATGQEVKQEVALEGVVTGSVDLERAAKLAQAALVEPTPDLKRASTGQESETTDDEDWESESLYEDALDGAVGHVEVDKLGHRMRFLNSQFPAIHVSWLTSVKLTKPARWRKPLLTGRDYGWWEMINLSLRPSKRRQLLQRNCARPSIFARQLSWTVPRMYAQPQPFLILIFTR